MVRRIHDGSAMVVQQTLSLHANRCACAVCGGALRQLQQTYGRYLRETLMKKVKLNDGVLFADNNATMKGDNVLNVCIVFHEFVP